MSQEDDTSKGCSQPVYLETMNIPINCGKINIIFTLKSHKSIELAVFDNLMELQNLCYQAGNILEGVLDHSLTPSQICH